MLPIKVTLSTLATQDGENNLVSIYPDLAKREQMRKPTNIWIGIICDTSGSMEECLHYGQYTSSHTFASLNTASPSYDDYAPMYLDRTFSSAFAPSSQDTTDTTLIECDLGNGIKRKVQKNVSLSKLGIAQRAIAKAIICLAFDSFVQTLALDIVFYSDVVSSQISSSNVKSNLDTIIDKIMSVSSLGGGTDITCALPIMLTTIEQRKHTVDQSYMFCVTDGYDFGDKTTVASHVTALHKTGISVLPTMCIGVPNIDFDPLFASYISTGKSDAASFVCAKSATEIADKMMHILLGGANLNALVLFASDVPIIDFYINGRAEQFQAQTVEHQLNVLSHMFVVLPKTASFKIMSNDKEYHADEIDNEIGIRFQKVLHIRKQIEAYDEAKNKYIAHAQNLLHVASSQSSDKYIREMRQLFFDAVRAAYVIHPVQDSDIVLQDTCSQALQLVTYLLRVEEERRLYVQRSLKTNFVEGLVVVDDNIYNSPESDSMSAPLYVLSSRSPSSGLSPPAPSASLSTPHKTQECGSVLCAVCMVNKKNVMFVPCKHVCVCVDCYQVMNQQQLSCPLCRQDILNIVAVKGTNSGICMSCNQNEAKCCLLPCSHLVVCENCVTKSIITPTEHKCPLCSTHVAMFFNAFV